MVNSPPCQVEAVSSHPINTPSGQVGVTPCNPEGIKPFTLVNSPPGQVGVNPRNSEGIEPFTMVNSPPCQVKAMSSHPINTPSGPLGVASLTFSQGSISDSPCVAPVSPLTSSMSVLVLITDGSPPVMSPPCPLSPQASSSPLKIMQAMSHEQPVDLPVGSDCP